MAMRVVGIHIFFLAIYRPHYRLSLRMHLRIFACFCCSLLVFIDSTLFFLCGAWQKCMYVVNKKAHTVRTRRQTRRDVMSNWKRRTWRKRSVDDLLWRDRKDIVCYLAFRMIDISEQRRARLFNLFCCCACVLCAHPAFPYVYCLLCSALSDAKQRRTRAKTHREEGAYFFFFLFFFDFINMFEIPWQSRNGKAADSLKKLNVKETSNCGKRVNIFFFYSLILWINYAWIHASAPECVCVCDVCTYTVLLPVLLHFWFGLFKRNWKITRAIAITLIAEIDQNFIFVRSASPHTL